MILEHHPYILPVREFVTDRDHVLSHNNRMLYGDWLFDLFRDKTWAALNFNWPDQSTPVPDDRDRYIFSWHLEAWPVDWLIAFADSHPNQEIIVISEFDDCAVRPNICMIRYHCWHLVIPTMLARWNTGDKFRTARTKLLSCLCGKPNFYRALVFSFMDQFFSHDDRVVVSWNATADYLCPSLGVLDVSLPIQRLEQLRQHYFDHDLLSRQVVVGTDLKTFDPWDHWNSNWSAYDTWISVTNETYCRSDLHDLSITRTPGPYLSEKTWKALIQGLAIVPNGMPGTYGHLAELGFATDHPWSMQFDSVTGDLDRLDRVFDTIEWILAQDATEVIKAILPTCTHNWHHVRSNEFAKRVHDINGSSLDSFFGSGR